MHLSMVSPVYNEEDAIVEFVERATAVLARLGDTFEMILVNDCSTDATPSLLQDLEKKHPQLRLISLSRNVGQQAATLLGLRQAAGDLVFLLDSDLQTPPEDMEKLFAAGMRDDDWDVVIGARQSRSERPLRSLASRGVTWIINRMAGSRLEDPASTFLLIKQAALRRACKNDVLAQNFSMLLSYMRLRFRHVPVERQANTRRTSSYSLLQLFEILLLAILRYSSGRKTLMFLLFVGCLSLGLGTLGTAYLILSGIIHQAALPTNLLVFTTALAVAGLQFLLLGVIIYKIETLYRNLDFRQNLNCFHDD